MRRPARPRRWSARLLTLAWLGAGLVVADPTSGQAAAPVHSFASVDVVQAGCQSLTVASITEQAGVRHYAGGRRLRFPTGPLPYDRSGHVVLTAKPEAGRTVTTDRYDVAAPVGCFTDLGYDSGPGGSADRRKLSWCRTEAHPVLRAYATYVTVPYTGRIRWQLVDRTGRVVASGGPGRDGDYPVVAAVPHGLPAGRYDLELVNTASDPALFPLSYPVYGYDCVTGSTERRLARFVNPSTEPARVLVWYGRPQDRGSSAPDRTLVLPAHSVRRLAFGHSRRLSWEAYPTGPGQQMGAGRLTRSA